MKIKSLSLCLSAIILLASCTKEKVPAPGINQTGATSAPAFTVIASEWESASLTWSDDPADPNSLQTNFGSAITKEMLDNGIVLIYAKEQASGTVNAFPARFDLNDTEYDSYSCEVEPNTIKLELNCYRGGQFVTPAKNDNVSFRYIYVGNAANLGHITTAASGTYETIVEIETGSATEILPEDLKNMDYESVVSLLNIDK